MNKLSGPKWIGAGLAYTLCFGIGCVLTEPHPEAKGILWSFQPENHPDTWNAEVRFAQSVSRKLAQTATESEILADIPDFTPVPSKVETVQCEVKTVRHQATDFVLDCTLIFRPLAT